MSSSTSPLRGIIFDMDGVLCDSEPFICAAAIQMFQETYNQRVVKEDFAPFVGAGEDRFIGGVAEKYGVTLTMPRDKLRTYAIYLEIIKGCLKPLPGAVDFIRDARKRGLRTAVATGADQIKMDGNLREIGVSPSEFEALITGDDVERKKPDPQIFLQAASRIAVPPAECLVVEDAVNGVRAAKAAGCRCLALTTSFTAQTLRDAGADFIAADLATVPPAVLENA
jgi:beta-phosphoglucomutase